AVYDIKIAYVDEDDGNCTYTVDIKGKEVASWVADKNPTKDSIFIYSINDVKLDYATEIKITGTRNKGEGARIAYLDITYSSGMSIKSVLKYTFSYLINNMPVTSIFVLLLLIFTFLIVNILFIILFRPRKKSPEISHKSSKQPDNSSIVNDNSNGISDEDPVTSTTDTSYQTVDTSLIDKMKMYLDNNFSDTNFSVQEMADNFNLSINYLSSYFKEQTSENIINYITCLRIEKAKHLLVTTDFPIKKIAESSGYYNVSSFIRRFRQITGVTPGKYREDNMG
ncbi:MAG TPA: AraC family transcriptional regulator, partial [Acetivibrio sp.]|nr:AraC family transcriptional regulator [Acetivibrio sp.]